MRNKSSFCELLYLRFIKTVLDRSEPPTHSRGKLCLGGASAQNKPTTHRKEEPFGQHPGAQPLLGWMFLGVSRCRCWWANAGAGTRGDAGWSLSPERRCYGLWVCFFLICYSVPVFTHVIFLRMGAWIHLILQRLAEVHVDVLHGAGVQVVDGQDFISFVEQAHWLRLAGPTTHTDTHTHK